MARMKDGVAVFDHDWRYRLLALMVSALGAATSSCPKTGP